MRWGKIALYENENKFRGQLSLVFLTEQEADEFMSIFKDGKKSVQVKDSNTYHWVSYRTGPSHTVMTYLRELLGPMRPQAELIIEMRSRKFGKPFKKSGKKLPIEELTYRRGLIKKMREENARWTLEKMKMFGLSSYWS